MKETSQEKLIKLAEKLGYQGSDASLEESLFEYGMLIDKEGFIIYALVDYDKEPQDLRYDYSGVDEKMVREELESLGESFYSFADINKEEALKADKYSQHDIINYVSSINSYNGAFRDSCVFGYDIDDIIDYLEKHRGV